MKKNVLFICILAIILSLGSFSFAQMENQPEIAGELFNTTVPISNYYFAKRVVMTFGAKWRGTPQDEQELEDMVWQELLFSYEAFQRGIEVTDAEVDAEIEKILKANKVEFSWRTDKEEFKKWTEDTLKLPIEAFRNQMQHLVKLEKLRNEIIDGFDPEVSEDEAYQKFLNEYNTLLVELKQFDEKADAQNFYKQANKPHTKKDIEMLIWNDLLYSYEASNRNIETDDDAITNTIQWILLDHEVRFAWKKDRAAYEDWVKEKFNTNAGTLRKMLSALQRADTLRQQIREKTQPPVDEEGKYAAILKKSKKVSKAYKNFVKKYVRRSKDTITFDSTKKAKQFYSKINRVAGFWADQKRLNPDDFKRPGFVALDFLLHMWGFDKDAAYEMLEKELGSFYPPATIYKGYGVFKILKIRRADPAEYDKRKDQYFEKVKMIKKYDLYKEWVEELKKQANIKRFVDK